MNVLIPNDIWDTDRHITINNLGKRYDMKNNTRIKENIYHVSSVVGLVTSMRDVGVETTYVINVMLKCI